MNNVVIGLLVLAVIIILTAVITNSLLKSKPVASAESRLTALLADAEKSVRSQELKFKHSPSVTEDQREMFAQAIQRRNSLKAELNKVRGTTVAQAHA